MSTPVHTEVPADETKVYDGPAHTTSNPHAVPNTDAGHGGHDGPMMDLKPMPTGVVVLLLAGFVVLMGAFFALGLWPRHESRKAAEAETNELTQGMPVVGVAMPKPPSKLPTLEVPGDAQAFQVTDIYPRTNGYLKRRLVDIGDKVKEGQLLAEIDTPEIDAQLAAAQAQLQQAQSAAQKAKDDFELTEATYQRYETFAKTGGITQQQLDERKSAYTSAKATYAGATANVKSDEAEVQRLTALQGFTKVTAPFAGTITTRGFDTGALLTSGSSGQALFQIAQVDIIRVFIDVPQIYASSMKVGQPVKFVVRNYPATPFEGYVARLSGALNPSTRTMRIEADFPNDKGLLFPGMYGTLRYEIQQPMEQLVIPSSALVFGSEGMRVALVDGQNKIKFQPVTLGVDLGTEVEVVKGLSKSDRIVANPGERLTDGMDVQIADMKAPAQPGTAVAGADAKAAQPTAEASAR